jgi:hypothetical protein
VKCLHAHVAHELATGDDEIGRWALDRLDRPLDAVRTGVDVPTTPIDAVRVGVDDAESSEVGA